MNEQYDQYNQEELRIDLSRPQNAATAMRHSSKDKAPTYSTAEMEGYRSDDMSGARKVTSFVGRSIGVTFKYFLSKLLASAVITVGLYFVLMYFDVKWAIAWALAAGIGNLIPVFGQWVGMVISIGGVWYVTREWKMALVTVGALIVLQILDEFVFTPLIVGKATSVKPVLIIIIMLLASNFFGFWGILFAVPAAACVKLFYEIFLQKEVQERFKKK